MASLRLLARVRPSNVLCNIAITQAAPKLSPNVFKIIKRDDSYLNCRRYDENFEYPDFEVSTDPKEWVYVERLLPIKTVPKPKTDCSKGQWKSQTAKFDDNPYFIYRTKNHMQPVYLERSFRGMRRITKVRFIDGDIWALNNDLKAYIEKEMNTTIFEKVNEFAGFIKYKTDCVKYVKQWMDLKGF